MIVDLPSSTTSAVNRKLVELRESGGVLALGRVLTLVIVTDDGSAIEKAIEAGNSASREHPCRVIVLARGQRRAAPRLDAQIRVGGDAGASEVVVLRGYGQLAAEEAGAGMVMPLLLPDAPVVAWWPGEAPAVPSKDPIGRLAQRRITDSLSAKNPIKAFEQRRASHAAGDTDLAWTRLTHWRALLAAALDFPPHDTVTAATVSGEAVSPSTDLMAGWLACRLGVQGQAGEGRPGRRDGVGAAGAPVGARRAAPPGRAHRHAAPARPAGPADRAGPAHRAGLPGRGAAPAGPGRRVRRGAGRGRADLARPLVAGTAPRRRDAWRANRAGRDATAPTPSADRGAR